MPIDSKITRDTDRRKHDRREGYVYLAVLFTSLLVVVSVSTALTISTAGLSSLNDRAARSDALRLAESELHRHATLISQDLAWRYQFEHDRFTDWYVPTVDGKEITSAQVRVRFSDDDGDLSDNPFDHVRLTVHVAGERSTAAVTATLQPDPVPYDVLRYSVTAADDIVIESGGSLSCEKPVQVFDDCSTFTSGVLTAPRLECDDRFGVTVRGDLGTDDVQLPAGDVLADYIAQGTEIPSSSLPSINGRLVIRDAVISPNQNPYGVPDASGIYWIDAGGGTLRIRNSRIHATLAIRNAAVVEIRGAIHWEYPTQPDAILVSDAPIHLANLDWQLSESDRGTNFNPIGSPYRGVLADGDTSDTYPTDLRGVIYTNQNVQLDGQGNHDCLHLTGTIVCNDLQLNGSDLQIHALDELLANPPRGLSDPTPMRFIRGSLRQVAAP